MARISACMPAPALARRLGEAAAQHDGRAHAGLAAALQLLGDVLGRDDEDGEVGAAPADRRRRGRPSGPSPRVLLRLTG